jgi:hypothetical protein
MKKILKQMFNLWANHVKHIEFLTLFAFYQVIKTGKYRKEVEQIRNHIKQGNYNLADTFKKKLVGITYSAIFCSDKNRKKDNMVEYTGVIVLDIDNLTEEQITRLKAIIIKIPQTLMCFISPSGMGLKIIVVTDNRDAEKHKTYYQEVINYYKEQLNVEFDEQTNDITRLCYVSDDPDAYFNTNAEIFNCESEASDQFIHSGQSGEAVQNNRSTGNSKNTDQQFLHQMKYADSYTRNKVLFEKGSRNRFIYTFASNCNRYGHDKEKVLNYCLQHYIQEDFTKEEIIATINSAYERTEEFGIWVKKEKPAKQAISQSKLNENAKDFSETSKNGITKTDSIQKTNITTEIILSEKDDSIQLDSPYISHAVKECLPVFMQKILSYMESEREKDIFIIGFLTVISGIIEAHGIYNRRKNYPVVYSFISAPPASGKGALNYCHQLILPLHKMLKQQSEDALLQYQLDLQDYNIRKANKEKDLVKPEKPPYKTVLIPANSSSSQIVEHLSDNGEKGVIIETEADTLTQTLNTDFGNFSDILRKAYEHEHISLRRKTNKEYLELYDPRLAVTLSGTPDQLKKLINSVENGLFSRFIYYVFQTTPKWKDVSPVHTNEKPLHTVLEETGNYLAEKLVEQQRIPIEFHLTDHQWKQFNEIFKQRVQEMSCFVGEDISANICRLGSTTFRIAMVLSVLNRIDHQEITDKTAETIQTTSEILVCSDEVFEMAMSLSHTFYQHLEFAFKLIRNTNEVMNTALQSFLNILPERFDRRTAVEIAKNSGINVHERTIDKYLKRLAEYQYLVKVSHNQYEKRGN